MDANFLIAVVALISGICGGVLGALAHVALFGWSMRGWLEAQFQDTRHCRDNEIQALENRLALLSEAIVRLDVLVRNGGGKH